MLPPHFPRRRLQRLMNFGALSRGFGTCCLRFKNDVATIPARLTSGWLARLCREGVDPLDRCKRFQVIHPPFLDLAWRKGSFIMNLPLASHHSITSSSSVGGMSRPSAGGRQVDDQIELRGGARMRVCYPSRPSARMVSCTFGLAPIRAMYALMFGHFARSILWILVQLSTVNR